MQVSWQPFDLQAERKRDALASLFWQGIDKQVDQSRLLQLLQDITALSALDTDFTLQIARALVEYAPDLPSSWAAYAQSLRLNGQADEALEATHRGLEIGPEDINLLISLGKLNIQTKELESAQELLRRAYGRAPEISFLPLCETLIRLGEFREADKLLIQCENQFGPSTSGEALAYVIACQSNDRSKLDQLKQKRLISISEPSDQLGAEKVALLNKNIVSAIDGHPALVNDPRNTATSMGKQAFLTNILPAALIEEIIAMIQMEAQTYFSNIDDHGKLKRLPDTLSITSWLVALDRGGFQESHIHPAGLFSGVYYVNTGRAKDDDSDHGAIVFWSPPKELIGQLTLETCKVKPRSGQMLIFPSCYYHHTLPHEGPEPRVSLSFDIS